MSARAKARKAERKAAARRAASVGLVSRGSARAGGHAGAGTILRDWHNKKVTSRRTF